MTPKEKAIELVEAMYKVMPYKDAKLFSHNEFPKKIIDAEYQAAKQCALISINQSIEVSLLTCEYGMDVYFVNGTEYLQYVKNEIELL